MSASSPLFDGPGLQALFADLDAELRTIDGLPVIELAVVGGAAMALQWNLRSTRDVDFVSEGVPQDLRDAAGRVDDAVFLGHQYEVTTADKLLELVTEAYGTRPLDVRVQYFATEVAARIDGVANLQRPTLRQQPPGDELGREL